MSANPIPCPVCGHFRKTKRRGRHPHRVWECARCGSLFKVPRTKNSRYARRLNEALAAGKISPEQAKRWSRVTLIAPPTKPPYSEPADGPTSSKGNPDPPRAGGARHSLNPGESIPVNPRAYWSLQDLIWGLELDQLAKYVQITAKALHDSAEEFAEKVQAAADQTPDSAEFMDRIVAPDVLDRMHTFPAMSHAATLITIYSFLEHELIGLCNTLQQQEELGLGVSDLGRGGIDQCRKYLEKGLGYEFPSQTDEWREIKSLQRVRNVVVHRRGKLEREGDADVRKYLAGKNTAKISDDQIVLSEPFCLEAIETVRAFLNRISAMLSANVPPQRKTNA